MTNIRVFQLVGGALSWGMNTTAVGVGHHANQVLRDAILLPTEATSVACFTDPSFVMEYVQIHTVRIGLHTVGLGG